MRDNGKTTNKVDTDSLLTAIKTFIKDTLRMESHTDMVFYAKEISWPIQLLFTSVNGFAVKNLDTASWMT